MRTIHFTKLLAAHAGVFALFGSVAVQGGEVAKSQADWFERYKKQDNVPKPAEMLLNEDQEPSLTEGFVELFNGEDLTGWKLRQGEATFEVKDGVIVGTALEGSSSTYLCTEREDYTDFVFSCEVKWEKNLNTGIMFRAASRVRNGAEQVYGPQAEMEGTKMDRCWSGGVYGQSCGGYFYPVWLKAHKEARAALKPKDWNRITIEAKGKVVKTWLNGVPISHWVGDGTYSQGFFGLQVHQAKSGQVLFRKFKVQEATK